MHGVGWLVIGLAEGFLAARLSEDEGVGLVVDMVLGVAGAVAAGLMFSSFGVAAAGFGALSLIAAVVGAVVVLAVYKVLVSDL
jgi:uncharacterized membrane protein YeaQ/YmgE (transglycosylase-associated protein family)